MEVDHDKDGVFTDMGATQILSTPYAMFATPLGNAGGVKAELNGKPQKPFGPSGKVARDILLKR